ncbi:MAG TPA: amidase, partial [Alphaproteobacteria bacterium]|nr:amidase [Alphaproteobacteria bacterium]
MAAWKDDMAGEEFTARAAAAAVRDGRVTAEELTAAHLERIAAHEETVHAWAFIDPEHATGQARRADAARRTGRPSGPLHGLPVGVQDTFDTEDMPTGDGSVLHAGRTPSADATVVAQLRVAGAVVMGKTATAELASGTPGEARNPHDPGCTAGAGAGGSAAAVAAGMVPLALGAQADGSVILPAALCGVVGYKPTHGLISRSGVLRQSRTLDQVGVFARNVEDAALLAEAVTSYDPADRDMLPRARPPLCRGAG